MTWAEYDQQEVSWPHVRVFCGQGDGMLLYYGAEHLYQPEHPQMVEIEALWDRVAPTLALNEGGHPPVLLDRNQAIGRHGEPGLVRFLAGRDDVPVTTLEPEDAAVVAWLRRFFSAEDIKLFHVLRGMQHFPRRESDRSYEEELDRILRHYANRPGLSGTPGTPREVRSALDAVRPGAVLLDIPREWFDPSASVTVFNRISRVTSDYRDRHMLDLLSRLVAQDQRVFAVVGGSHVLMQEAALASRLGVPAEPVSPEGFLCQNGARD